MVIEEKHQSHESWEFLDRCEPTIPSRYYYEEAIYQREKELIFHDMWFYVGRANEIPNAGDYMVRQIVDESAIITRDKRGEVHAFYNVCRHRGTKLCQEAQGRFNGGAFACKYHGWTYGLDGKLLATPNMVETDDFDMKDYPLFSAPIETMNGFLFVNLSDNPKPIRDQLGYYEDRMRNYPIADLQVGKIITYDVKANWKIIVENYSECLHCPGVHPALCDIVPVYRKGILTEPDDAHGNYIVDNGYTFTPNGKSNRPLFPGLNESEKNTYGGGTLLPNLLVNLHPDCVMTHAIWPEGPGKTKVVCEWLFEPSTMERSDFNPDDIVQFWDTVNVEDWEVCEMEQTGVQSKAYQRGIYAPQEGSLHRFNRWVMETLALE